jgi:hypothetical protein
MNAETDFSQEIQLLGNTADDRKIGYLPYFFV